MKKSLALLGLIFLPLTAAPAKPLIFQDFTWGMSPYEVELKAGSEGFRLREKINDPDKVELIYRATLLERESTVTFSFTPLSQKMFHVRIAWPGTAFGYILLERLKKNYKIPRVEMPGLHTYIWTKQDTEAELRHGREETLLLYTDLNLWNTFREEIKTIEEKKEEETSDASQQSEMTKPE